MTIVVQATDCRANQCKPIAQHSAKIVTTRPAQESTMQRLVTAYSMSTLWKSSRNGHSEHKPALTWFINTIFHSSEWPRCDTLNKFLWSKEEIENQLLQP